MHSYVYHTVYSGIICHELTGAVKRDQTNDSVGKRPTVGQRGISVYT